LRHHDTQHASTADEKLVVFGRTVERRQLPPQSSTDRYMQTSWERLLANSFPQGKLPDTECIGAEAENMVFFGLNCSMSRDLFLQEGGFDAQLRSDEETEMGCRLYRRGYLFAYVEKAEIAHLNSKNLAEYYPACWARSGLNDLYRARSLDQRCAQNAQLAARRHGTLRERCVTALVWLSPRLVLKAAALAQGITDTTNSYLSFALWARARRLGEYWNAVKSAGVTRRELDQLAGPAARVLMFHSVSMPQSEAEAKFYLPGPQFRQVLATAAALGYVVAHPDDLVAATLPAKSVILTFDDAYDDLYTDLLPIMMVQRLAPLIFVVAGRIGGKNDWDQKQGLRARALLTVEQLREMQKWGAVIGSHSMTHASLPTLSAEELRREVRDSKHRLEDTFGCAVDWFAYPFGHTNRKVRAAVAEAGFKAAVTTAPGLNGWQDRLVLHRIDINSNDSLLDVAGKLLTGKDIRGGIRNRVRRRWAALRHEEPYQ
jgi:peptidoglycan/xylan/chitin deacetylase (PgdA/CDA1 family)